jgi:hypothetical protein
MKKLVLFSVLATVVAGGIFAQQASETPEVIHKHQPFDMLLGLNFGFGVTPNIGDLFKTASDGGIPKGNYALTFDFGLTYDFYLYNWLSFNTGLLLHPDIYLILDQNFEGVNSFTDIASAPLCLTIPLAAHINVPKLEWLYAGIGLNLNIPLSGMLDGVVSGEPDEENEDADFSADPIDTKGDFFVGLPIDIGFDFVKAGRGGGRFFIRITPEFHKKGVAVPIGFIWQIYNWKIYSKK